MTRFLCIFCSTFLSLHSFGQLIQWEPEIIVADGAIYGNVRPRATMVGNSPVVIFGNPGQTQNLSISRWNGNSFDPPVSILPVGTSCYIADWTGPDIDATGDTIIATFKMDPQETGHVYTVRSTDGGITFSDTIRADSHEDGVAWMPSMAMDANGQPVISYMAHDVAWSNPRYVLVRSANAGMSYSPEEEISQMVPGEACDCCPSELIQGGDNEVLLFRNNEQDVRDVFAVYSADNGVNFNSFTNVDQLGWTLSACPSTGADGVFYGNKLLTAYASAASGKYRVYISSSLASDSISFENRVQVAEPNQANGSQNYPRIALSNDTVVMAWRESISGNQEIFCSLALPGSDPLMSLAGFKQQSNATTAGSQTNPEIMIRNGTIHLFYQDDGTGNLIYRRGTISTSAGIQEHSFRIGISPNPSGSGIFYADQPLENITVSALDGTLVPFTTETEGGKTRISVSYGTGILLLRGTTEYGAFCARLLVE